MIRIFGLCLLFSSVSLASPAAELGRQYLEFISQYHVDADTLDLKKLKIQVEAALQTRCGIDASCPASKMYDDLKRLTPSLDKTSSFISQPELERIRLEQLGDANLDTRFALGIELRENIVYRVLTGSSASDMGVKRGDKLLGMTREGRAWSLAQTVFPDDTPVNLRLERAGQAFELTVTPAAGLLMGLLAPEGRMLGENTAYIRIPSFKSIGTAQKVHNLLSSLQNRGAKRLVLDLRFNSGGYLDETLLTLSSFYQGEILKLRSRLGILTYLLRNGSLEAIGSPNKVSLEFPQTFQGKVVVLINNSTSSAAEVMCLAWQRASYTKFVGESSAGRSVYATLPIQLLEGSELRLAAIRHLYPSEQPLQEKLSPDVLQKDDLQALNKGTDPILEVALRQLEIP